MSNIITSKQDASQVLRLAFEDATQSIRVQTGSPNGEPAPASSIPVGAVDPDGNLQPLHVDEFGALEVTFAATAEQVVVQPDGTKLHATIDASALPTGASTSALQTTGNSSLSSIDTKLTSQATAANQTAGNASLSSIDTKTPALTSGRVPVDGSGVTQPVSAASLPLPTGAATSANQATEIATLNSLDTKATSTNASLSSIDTKLTAPLSVTGPLTDTELRAAPVPVSLTSTTVTGTVAVTGPLTDTQLRATPVPVSGTIATGGLTDAELRATPVPVSGSVTTGGLTDTQLRATAVPVSLTSTTITGSVAVTGPLTDTQLRATPVPVSGTVTTGGLTDTQLRATPVPVSGTVTANAGTNLNTSALNLEATQSAMSAKLPATLGQKTMAASMAVVIASDQTAIPTSSSSAGKAAVAKSYKDYGSGSVTTGAYVQLVASTSAAITHLSIFDSSGQAMIIATGAAASEVDQIYVGPGGGEYQLAIPSGTRISIKALTGTASSGYQLLNGFGV